MGRQIRVGQAGYGFSGRQFHAPFIMNDPRYKLMKVMDRNSDQAAKDYPGVEVVKNFDALLTDDIDLVIIATPNKTHGELARRAIAAGKNLVVEKPVTPTPEEARELCALAKTKGVVFSVYQNRRFDGDFMTVRQVIDSGMIGDVVDYECHYDRFAKPGKPKAWKLENIKGNGPLYNLGVHIIDQVYVLFGMPEEVYADFRIQRSDNVFPDNFEIVFYYPDKKAIVSASEVVGHPGPHFMVHGRRGSFLKYGLDVQERDLVSGKRPADGGWGKDDPQNYGIAYDAVNDTRQIIPTLDGNYALYYNNLYDALIGTGELAVKPEEAMAVLELMEAALRSHEEKRRVSMKAYK